nr:hypothetical protein [Gemmatimonadota bacterium]
MKPGSILAIRYALVGAVALSPCGGAAQIAQPGEQDPGGRVYTHIVARVGELGANTAPIPGLTVYVVSEDGRRVTLRTNMAGVAASWLARARYRIVTPDPFQLDGRLYTWDTIFAIRPGQALIRLHVANAKSQAVPVVAWAQGAAGSGQTLEDGQTVWTLARDGVAISASLTRDEDLLWADVTISNGSKRRLDLDPKTLTLHDLSPRQSVMRYRPPAEVVKTMMSRGSRIGALMSRRSTKKVEDILSRALPEVTLMPGQDIAGLV